MGNELMTATDVRAQVNLIQEVMKAVMQKDTHYGVIPGCKKPSLWKPGAEKLLVTFRIAAEEPKIEDISTPDCVRYRVSRTGRSIVTGVEVGAGVGECSSDEEKYKWRKPVCDEEWVDELEDRKREVWKRSGKDTFKVRQVRTQKADIANTILKMADKRAYIGMTLVVTAASDIFTQDIEDLPEEMRPTDDGADPIDPPQVKKKAEPKKAAPKSKANTFTIKPSTISTKDGEGARGPWHKVAIKYEGEWYSTLDEADGKAIEEAKDSHEVTVAWEQSGQYRNITSVS